MSQHQSVALPIPHRISSVSRTSSNELLSRKSSRSPLSGLDSILAKHQHANQLELASPKLGINNNILVDNEYRRKYNKASRIRGEIPSDRSPAVDGALSTRVADTGTIPQKRELRPRASSPLLGQRFQTQSHDPLPPLDAKTKYALHSSESTSTLRSSQSPLASPSVVSLQTQKQAYLPASSSTDLPFRTALLPGSQSEVNLSDLEQLQPYLEDQRNSKPKHRPPMIDLSKLFPKPSEPAVRPPIPLLSPQRMTMSPSPVSVRSDGSFGRKMSRTGNKLTKSPSSKELAALRKQHQQRQEYSQSQTELPLSRASQAAQYPQPSLQQKRQEMERREREERERYYQQQKREQQMQEEEQRRKQQEQEQYYQRQRQEKRIQEEKRRQEEQERRRQQEAQEKRRLQEEQRRELESRERQKQEKQKELRNKQLRQSQHKPLGAQNYQFPFQEKRHTFQRKAPVEWFDGPQGQVSSDDEDEEEDQFTQYSYRTAPALQAVPQRSGYSRDPSMRASVLSNARSEISRASSRTLILSSAESVRKLTEFPTSPTPLSPATSKLNSHYDWDFGSTPTLSPGPGSTTLSRKSSRLTLDKSNLTEASVLCLSSSEDEDEEEEEVPLPSQRRIRDSIATFDEGASEEIFTAKVIPSSRRPSVAKIRNGNTQPVRPSRPTERKQPTSREHSASSSVRSPHFRPPSSIPTISEPESPPPLPASSTASTFDFQLPPSRKSNYQSPPPANRRSRVMAVTRQEEHLLEVIRRHKGNMPPSYLAGGDSLAPEPSAPQKSPSSISTSQPSYSSSQSRTADTSFLTLSPSLPHPRKSPLAYHAPDNTLAAASAESDSSMPLSRSALSENSNPSPRISLVHSDTLPSPSTSWTSPRTPTLTHHHLPPRNGHVPPPFPSPSTIPDTRRHSRTRTDSSSAMVFGEADDDGKSPGGSSDLPIWALGWSTETPGLAVVH
ncbi:hypothetical protein FQN53_007999 [Emmonsiellopsis sp. PD_33]|nr:hypothetical protein FQN53_007999 [Emmonsiellopsis sp. PD_33]